MSFSEVYAFLNVDTVHVKAGKVAEVVQLLDAFKQDGSNSFQVVADFDYTLTRLYDDNHQELASTISVQNDSPLLSSETKQRLLDLKEMYIDKYYYNPDITREKKAEYILEWLQKWTSALAEDPGFNRNAMVEFAKKFQLRRNCREFFELLDNQNIPTLVFSAGFEEIITEVFKQSDCLFKTVELVGNYFDWDQKTERPVKLHLPHVPIHKTSANCKGYFERHEDRRNVMLLGDHLSDVDMASGLSTMDYRILRVAHLNLPEKEWLEKFQEVYDIVLVGDSSMNVPMNIVKCLI